jgi:hypothetical protein
VLIQQSQSRVRGTWAAFVADPKTGAAVGGNLLKDLMPTAHSVPMMAGHDRVEV